MWFGVKLINISGRMVMLKYVWLFFGSNFFSIGWFFFLLIEKVFNLFLNLVLFFMEFWVLIFEWNLGSVVVSLGWIEE